MILGVMKEHPSRIMGGKYKDDVGQKFRVIENHRITEWVRLEETTVGNLVQSSCSSVIQSTWHRIVSRRVLDISSEEDSTSSMGNLCQCLVTQTGKKFYLISIKFSLQIFSYHSPHFLGEDPKVSHRSKTTHSPSLRF